MQPAGRYEARKSRGALQLQPRQSLQFLTVAARSPESARFKPLFSAPAGIFQRPIWQTLNQIPPVPIEIEE